MIRATPPDKTTSRTLLDPFDPQPDKRFYYAFEAFEQRLAVLRRLLKGTDALILVTGEQGSGKTTLLQRLLATADLPFKPCRVQTAGSPAVGRLPRLKQGGPPTAFLLKDPAAAVLLMDDAHRLSRKELRKLLRDTLTPDPARKIKRLVLFGQPRLSNNFHAVSGGLVDETALNKIYLPVITEEEAAAYIRHRVAVAGYTGKNPFTPTIIKKLYNNSAGLPGRISANASRWWTRKGFPGSTAPNTHRRKAGRFRRLAAWSAAGAAAVILAVAFWPSPQSEQSTASRPSTKPQMVRIKIHGAGGNPQPRGDIAAARPTARQPVDGFKPVDAPPAAKSQQRPAADRDVTEPPAGASGRPPQPDSGSPARIHREDWLMAQDPSSYTIQVLGVRSEQSLLAFVGDHRLDRSGKAAYYRSRYKGRTWFPLVYGTYSSASEARRAIAGLPERIRRMSPWIRKMSAVQDEIQKAGKP